MTGLAAVYRTELTGHFSFDTKSILLTEKSPNPLAAGEFCITATTSLISDFFE